MDRAARTIESVVDEVERALMCESVLIGERDLHLVGECAALLLTLAQKRHVVGLAHVKIQIDRVGRDDNGQQSGGAGAGPAARNQVADRDLMGADAAREGCHDAGVVEVELSVAHGGQGTIEGRLGGTLLGGLLVGGLDAAGSCLLQRVCAKELAVGEIEARVGTLDLGDALAQLDLIGCWIDQEQQIALVDDVAVLEADLGQSAADLGTQLDLLDGRELAKELEPAVDLALKRGADGDAGWRRGRGRPG